MFDNLTPEDKIALARIQASPPDQIEHFKRTVRMLIDGYGENAPRHIIVLSIHRDSDRFEMDGINISEPLVRAMLMMGTEVLNSNASQQEAPSTLQ
jgi:hypothetical protein